MIPRTLLYELFLGLFQIIYGVTFGFTIVVVDNVSTPFIYYMISSQPILS